MDDAPFERASDEALVAQLRHHRSESACRELYRRHTPALLRTAWRLLGQAKGEADDTVQEAWLRALTSLDLWRGESPFGAWLKGIAVHVALDTLRRDRRFTPVTDEVEIATEPAERDIDLERAIAALSPGYRAVLVLHDVEGFTHEEIGLRLGITAGTSRGQLFKARRAVRTLLTPAHEETKP